MTERKLAVVAVGGNSLIKDEKQRSLQHQYQVVNETARHIADLVEAGWDLAICHGNGPQLGFTLRRSEIGFRSEKVPDCPMDVCVAENQAEIGYALQQNLQNEMILRNINKRVVTVITQTVVDQNDPAYSCPTKPVGIFMPKEEALWCRDQMKWDVMEDAGRGWRRVVPSPFPKDILEFDTIDTLVKAGVIVISAGGGGIPVIKLGDGTHRGITGAVDKDLSASLLAQKLNADLLVISTAVEKVAINFGGKDQAWIDKMTLLEAKKYSEEKIHFAPGSMAPKIRSIIWFLENGGKKALVTDPENLNKALNGKTGTWFGHDGDSIVGI